MIGNKNFAARVVICALAAMLFASSVRSLYADDYLAARIAAAIDLVRKAEQEEKPRNTVPDDNSEKIIVTMYTATWCAPCQAAKRTLDKSQLPFEIKEVQLGRSGWPKGVDTIPHFEWDTPNGKLFSKWHSVKDLTGKVNFSHPKAAKPKSPATSSVYPDFPGYNPHWTWPGNLHQHLSQTHGISGPLTQDQAERIHDALHDGYSPEQLKVSSR